MAGYEDTCEVIESIKLFAKAGDFETCENVDPYKLFGDRKGASQGIECPRRLLTVQYETRQLFQGIYQK